MSRRIQPRRALVPLIVLWTCLSSTGHAGVDGGAPDEGDGSVRPLAADASQGKDEPPSLEVIDAGTGDATTLAEPMPGTTSQLAEPGRGLDGGGGVLAPHAQRPERQPSWQSSRPTSQRAEPAPEPDKSSRAGVIIKVIIGLSSLFLLAFLASHPRVKHLQAKLGIAQIMAAGFPFVALGLVARHPSVGVLTDDVLQELTPVLNVGLGWLGFIIGAQLDVRFLDKLPRGTGLLVMIEASAPFAVTTAICGTVMLIFGQDLRAPQLVRDALLLGAAGAMTATLRGSGLTDDRPWTDRSWVGGKGLQGLVSQLDEIVGVACLLFMVAFLRPSVSATTWQLPGTAWVFVTLGLGVALGLLVFVLVRIPRSGAEFLAVLLGFMAFGAGLAGYLRLSPLVVCFLAGVLVTNFPCEQRDSLMTILEGLERTIHSAFLIIAGALWDVGDWRGWVLVPCFVVGRFGGRWFGIFAGRRVFEAQGQRVPSYGAVITPLSVLSLALVVSVERLYRGDTIPWVMTAVIGGAIVTELIVQLVPQRWLEPAASEGRTGSAKEPQP